MCDHCQHDNSGDGGFTFGLVLGAVIGAVVAVYIYKNRQTDVFQNLQDKLTGYFDKFVKPTPAPTKRRSTATKLPVVLPDKIVKATTPARITAPKAKKFVKPKK